MPLRPVLAACLALLFAAACQRGEAPDPAAVPDAAPEAVPADAPQGQGSIEQSAKDPPLAAPPGGAEFPELRLTTIDGASWDLAERRGRWVVVNFWATWCAPCLKEMPELSALDAMREHVEVIGLAYEETDAATLRAFLEERPVVFPVAIVDTYDPPAGFPTPRGLPQTSLVAPDGRLVRTFLGPVTALDLERAIEAAGGPAVEAAAAGADGPGGAPQPSPGT